MCIHRGKIAWEHSESTAIGYSHPGERPLAEPTPPLIIQPLGLEIKKFVL